MSRQCGARGILLVVWMCLLSLVIAVTPSYRIDSLSENSPHAVHQLDNDSPEPLLAESLSSEAANPVQLLGPLPKMLQQHAAPVRKAPVAVAVVAPAPIPRNRTIREQEQNEAATDFLTVFDSLATTSAQNAAAKVCAEMKLGPESRARAERFAYAALEAIRPTAIRAAAVGTIKSSLFGSIQTVAAAGVKAMAELLNGPEGSHAATRGAQLSFGTLVAKQAWDNVKLRVPEFLNEVTDSIAAEEAEKGVASLKNPSPLSLAMHSQTVRRTHRMLKVMLDEKTGINMVRGAVESGIVQRTAASTADKIRAGVTGPALVEESTEFAARLVQVATAQAARAQTAWVAVKAKEIAKAQLAVVQEQSKFIQQDMNVVAQSVLQSSLWREGPAAIGRASKAAISSLTKMARDEMRTKFGVDTAHGLDPSLLVEQVAGQDVHSAASSYYFEATQASAGELNSAAVAAAKSAEGTGAHLPVGLAQTAAEHAFMGQVLPQAQKGAMLAAENVTFGKVLTETRDQCTQRLMGLAVQIGRSRALELLAGNANRWAVKGVLSKAQDMAASHMEAVGVTSQATKQQALDLAMELARNSTVNKLQPLLESSVLSAAIGVSRRTAQSALVLALQRGVPALGMISDAVTQAVEKSVQRSVEVFQSTTSTESSKFPGQDKWIQVLRKHVAASATSHAVSASKETFDHFVEQLAAGVADKAAESVVQDITFKSKAKKLAIQGIAKCIAVSTARVAIRELVPLSTVQSAVQKACNVTALKSIKRASEKAEPYEYEAAKATAEKADYVIRSLVFHQAGEAGMAATNAAKKEILEVKGSQNSSLMIELLIKAEVQNIIFVYAGEVAKNMSKDITLYSGVSTASKVVKTLSNKLHITEPDLLNKLEDKAHHAVQSKAQDIVRAALRHRAIGLIQEAGKTAFEPTLHAYQRRLELEPTPIAYSKAYDPQTQARKHILDTLLSHKTNKILQATGLKVMRGNSVQQVVESAVLVLVRKIAVESAVDPSIQKVALKNAKNVVAMCRIHIKKAAHAAAWELFASQKISDKQLTDSLLTKTMSGCEDHLLVSIVFHTLKSAERNTYKAVAKSCRSVAISATANLASIQPVMTAVSERGQESAERNYMLNAQAASSAFAKHLAPFFVNRLLPGLVKHTIGNEVKADGINRIKRWAQVQAKNMSQHLTSPAVRKAFKDQFTENTVATKFQAAEGNRTAMDAISGVLTGRISHMLAHAAIATYSGIAGPRIGEAIGSAVTGVPVEETARQASHQAEVLSMKNTQLKDLPQVVNQVATKQVSMISQALRGKAEILQQITNEETALGVRQSAIHFHAQNGELNQIVNNVSLKVIRSKLKELGVSSYTNQNLDRAVADCVEMITGPVEVSSHDAVMKVLTSIPPELATNAAQEAAYQMSERTTLIPSIAKAAREAAFIHANKVNHNQAKRASKSVSLTIATDMAPKAATAIIERQVLQQTLHASLAATQQHAFNETIHMCRQQLHDAASATANRILMQHGIAASKSPRILDVMREAVLSDFDAHNSWGGMLDAAVTGSGRHFVARLNTTIWESIEGAMLTGNSIEKAAQAAANASAAQLLSVGTQKAAAAFAKTLQPLTQTAGDRVAQKLAKLRSDTVRHAVERASLIIAEAASRTGKQMLQKIVHNLTNTSIVELGLKKNPETDTATENIFNTVWSGLGADMMKSANAAAIQAATTDTQQRVDSIVATAYSKSKPISSQQLQELYGKVAGKAKDSLVKEMHKFTSSIVKFKIQHTVTMALKALKVETTAVTQTNQK